MGIHAGILIVCIRGGPTTGDCMENQETPLRMIYDHGKVFLLLSKEEEDNGSWQLLFQLTYLPLLCITLRARIMPIATTQLTCSDLLNCSNSMAYIVSSDDKLTQCFKAVAPNFSELSALCVSQKAAPFLLSLSRSQGILIQNF